TFLPLPFDLIFERATKLFVPASKPTQICTHNLRVNAGSCVLLTERHRVPVRCAFGYLNDEEPGTQAMAFRNILTSREQEPTRRLRGLQRRVGIHALTPSFIALRPKEPLSGLVVTLHVFACTGRAKIVNNHEHV